MQLKEGTALAEFPGSMEGEYCQLYFEALDLPATSIHSRLDQKGFKTFCNTGQLLFKAHRGLCFNEDLEVVCNFFCGDFNNEDLAAELLTFHKLYKSALKDELPTVENIKTALLTLSAPQRLLLNTVCKLFQLPLILPATNVTFEQSFSALRCIKSEEHNVSGKAELSHDPTLLPGLV